MMLDWLVLARAAHVLGVVVWIGGVGFVTAVLLPGIRGIDDVDRRAELFERLEGRFAWVARGATLLVGASGFYMVEQYDLWDRFANIEFWWMHAMVAVWAIFTIMLFVAAPFFLHRRFARRLRERPDHTFALIQRAHWILFLLSALTIFGAVAGAHG